MYRPRLLREDSSCQLGAVHTWHKADIPRLSSNVRYNIVGDTVILVDQSGKPLTTEDRKYSRKLNPGNRPKQVAAQLLRVHHNAARAKSPINWNNRIAAHFPPRTFTSFAAAYLARRRTVTAGERDAVRAFTRSSLRPYLRSGRNKQE